MTLPVSGIYRGVVTHLRTLPRTHAFRYSCWMAFLDIDRIDELCAVSRLVSRNRFNWATFRDADHLGDPALPIRERLARDARAAGHELPAGPIFLLTNLRYLGYCFNPVSYWYCYREDGALALILAEVNNTFGESHRYWMGPAQATHDDLDQAYTFDKQFHVSPFVSMDCRYRFAFSNPGPRLDVHVKQWEAGRHFFDARLALEWRPWSATEIRRILWRHPAMTVKVIAGIHWEALRLWLKRLPIFTHPARRASPGPG